ncbi:uncharacterized protein L3040_002997 [Drepanopeziza brunnea f. sp. 'multigermtubi']|uniref:uncharacterized protein n=1 Tax=Drepanopeziza brunnea f. sp. 'multigermtubi' TaxID=698441 RepID=UPI00238AAA76|nr:hypothetical protein L3040_002997 [Drepanopeziza brunnea f. sp. 'multigermtubi']
MPRPLTTTTLLLCFIHGFKGDEETFFRFPDALRGAVEAQSPSLDVQTRVYPKYETRGDLAACVETFREWLQDQVTDLEQAAGNANAILEPSVGVVLIAHSMGGFVAADTLFSVLDTRPVSADPARKLMFPLIHGILAFDTPYNGLSRSMFAYGAFAQYQNLSSAWNVFATVSSSLAAAGTSSALAATTPTAQASSWMRWQTLAARTGTYGAIAAGGVAAYTHRDAIRDSLSKIRKEDLNPYNIRYRDGVSRGLTYVSRESIGEGFAWMAGHLKFVGALMKPAQLATRLERLSQLDGVGVADLYTSLGANGAWSGGYLVPKRTFCAVPAAAGDQGDRDDGAPPGTNPRADPNRHRPPLLFRELANGNATSEIEAHCGMFRPERNAAYAEMVEVAAALVGGWAAIDPREVRDEYRPTREQLTRSRSEGQLWDDDGTMLGRPRSPSVGSGVSEDEAQLDAILQCPDMPQQADGGVDEDAFLQRAAGVPLPPPMDAEVSGIAHGDC